LLPVRELPGRHGAERNREAVIERRRPNPLDTSLAVVTRFPYQGKGEAMRRVLLLFAFLAALASGPGAVLADELDGWCAEAKKASSIVICSGY
jgi:hypothetical protein